jgi:hypothetical protein
VDDFSENFHVHQLKHKSYVDNTNNQLVEFKKELENIVVNENMPFAMIRPHVDDDVCDFIFKVFRNDENCLYVCIDCKSESELKMYNNSSDSKYDNKHNDNNNNNNSKLNIESLTVVQPQYEQIKKSIEKIENLML